MTQADTSLLVDKLKSSFRHDIIDTRIFKGEVTHLVRRESIRDICNFLKTNPEFQMDFIVDVLGVDYYGEEPRFEVVYHLYSIRKKQRIRLKLRENEGESVPSITPVYAGADWPEREVYDMYGIVFEGHPNLKRIYLAVDWEGHPLRKDYPLRGYKDRYNPYGEDKPE